MLIQQRRLLLSPDATDEGGPAGSGDNAGTAQAGTATAAGSAAPNTDVLEDQSGTQGGEGGESGEGGEGTATTTAAAAAAPSALTKDDIQEILANVLPAATRQTVAPTAPAQPRELTPEEFDRTFNVFKPSERLLADLRGEDQAKALAAFHELRDGLIKQALTMTEYRIKQYQDHLSAEFNAKVEPLQSYVSESQARSFRDDFFKAHPDLEPYETIVDAVATKLSATGYQGKSRKEVMDRFAVDTQTVVDSLLKAGKGGAATGNGGQVATSATKTGTKGRMATLSGGGQGGSSRPAAGAGTAKGPAGIEVFD